MIIGINGYIGSGKDTVGMILQALTMEHKGAWYNNPAGYTEGYKDRPNLKGGWQIRKFAGKLKQIASIITGIPVEKFEDQEFKKKTFKQLAEEGYISKDMLRLLTNT